MLLCICALLNNGTKLHKVHYLKREAHMQRKA
jgi:hypothetical protein